MQRGMQFGGGAEERHLMDPKKNIERNDQVTIKQYQAI